MDALSALKLVSAPAAGGLPANPAQGLAGALTQSIPQAEMQQLIAAQGGGISPTSLAATPQLGTFNSDNPVSTTAPVYGGSGAGFEKVLNDFVGDVNKKQADAGNAVSGLLSGKNVSLHQAMISMEEANVSFQMMVEVRNRLLDGYQELMRMQV